MKRQTSAGQKAIAVAVLALTALIAVYCLSEPPAGAVPASSTPPADVHLSAASPCPTPDPAEELEEHGYYQDPLVNQGPLPNRQAPRRPLSNRKVEPEQRQYSRQAADEVVETILNSIISPDQSDAQKCAEIYYYVKGCITCDGASVRSSWEEAAYWGFTTGQGDEYTFYACSRALLTALGYQVRQVQREGGDLEEPHSWCLVNYGAGWYHFDPCPHLKADPPFICCLSTDQQLMDFDAGAQRDYYAFDPEAYPERVGGRADPANTVPMPRQDPEVPSPTSAPTSAPSSSPSPTSVDTPTPSSSPEVRESSAPSPSVLPSFAPTPTLSESPAVSRSPLPVESILPSPSATVVTTPSVQPSPSPEPTPPPAPIPTPEEPLLPPGA